MSLNVACSIKCLLGESPIWSPADESIYFIDIKKPAIIKFSTKSELYQVIYAPSEIGCIVLSTMGGLVAAMERGLAFVNFENSEFKFFFDIDNDCTGNRPNDGKCDVMGRLWIATMDKGETLPTGRLWCISSLRPHKIMDANFTIGNGIDWSPDSKKMYFTDSTNRTIYVYDFDAKNGSIKNKNVFVKISTLDGYPDGLTVDRDGYVWSAHWDGWRITRYTPNGHVDKIIYLPVPRPTSMIFGGSDLSKLYITSACYGLTRDQLERAPLSGSLFVYDSNVTGKPSNSFTTLSVS
jgi:sugar lactone lactonase YvrE